MNGSFEFIDNSDAVIAATEAAIDAALTSVGIQVMGYAVKNLEQDLPRNAGGETHGTLKNSISFHVDQEEKCVQIGTNLSYAKYNEYGTGVYADDGNGKQGFWVYVPDSGEEGTSVGSAKVYTEAEARRIVAMLKAKGVDAHMTKGMTPTHFLKRAVEEHRDKIIQIISDSLKDAVQ